jgi:hypothetical protein
VDNSILIVVSVACGVVLLGFAAFAAYLSAAKKKQPAALAPEPLLVAAPVQAQSFSPADPGYDLMTLLDRHAKSRAGNRVIDGAAEAMADDTVAALVRGASSAKGGSAPQGNG